MDLLNGWVFSSEAKLMFRDNVRSLMIDCSLLLNAFSNSLDIVDRSDIGRYDERSSSGFPGLGITMILAIFQIMGK